MSQRHPYQHQIDLCNRALEGVRPGIPVELAAAVDDYVNRFDEWGLGLEVLIDQLAEFEILITRDQFDLISAAMIAAGLGDAHRLDHLRDHGVAH